MINHISQLDFTKQYTYADYLTWQFEERVELIKGWVYKMGPAPISLHQIISGNLHYEFTKYLENKPCLAIAAPFDVRLTKKGNDTSDSAIQTVVQPDICIICDVKKIEYSGCLGAPDLIVEILSPSNTDKELKIKYDLYEENGVREYWVVHPENSEIDVHELIGEKYKLRKKYRHGENIPVGIFSGLTIDSEKVFSFFS